MHPGPVISARVTVVLALISMEGETFQPWPSSREACAPSPLVAMPAWPFSPVKFSGLMERDSTLSRRKIFSRFTPNVAPPWSWARSVEGLEQRKYEEAATRNGRNNVLFIFIFLGGSLAASSAWAVQWVRAVR